VTLETISDDGVQRRVNGFSVMPFDVPEGCIGGYYPECNPLLPLWHHAKESKVPGAKSIPVRISKDVPMRDQRTPEGPAAGSTIGML
jgi:hypothetical protein